MLCPGLLCSSSPPLTGSAVGAAAVAAAALESRATTASAAGVYATGALSAAAMSLTGTNAGTTACKPQPLQSAPRGHWRRSRARNARSAGQGSKTARHTHVRTERCIRGSGDAVMHRPGLLKPEQP